MFPRMDTKRKASREAERPSKVKMGVHNPPEVARSVVRATKRKASREAETPSKRKRGAHNPPEVARSIARATKRKASGEAETRNKRKSGAHNPPEVARSIARATKRKASGEAETRNKRKSGAHNPPEVARSIARATKRKASTEAETPIKTKSGAYTPPKEARSVASATKRQASTEAEIPSQSNRGDTSKTDSSPVSRGQSSSNDGNRLSFVLSHKTRADFNDKYKKLQELGGGGFGTVFAGLRKSDSLPVAIKCMPKETLEFAEFDFNGQAHKIPFEVLIMVAAAGPAGLSGKSAVIQLLDWYDLGEEVFLVMERPVPCVDLLRHLQEGSNQMDEHKAKVIMKQLVEAAIKMHAMGIFHRDLKLENILIQTTSDGPRVRIIDFGCGCYTQDGPYHSFFGSAAFAPPEYFLTHSYEAVPTTVWQLGALMFDLVGGSKRFDTQTFIRSEMKIRNELSPECMDLLDMCLAPHPDKRATLEQIREHPWLSCVNCDK